MSQQEMQAATPGMIAQPAIATHLPHQSHQSPRPVALDDLPLNRFHVKIAGLTFGAHFTEGYALGTIGYALTSLNRQIPLDAFWMGAIGCSALIGIFLGSLVLWLALGPARPPADFPDELPHHHCRRVHAVLRVLAARIVFLARADRHRNGRRLHGRSRDPGGVFAAQASRRVARLVQRRVDHRLRGGQRARPALRRCGA